MACLYSFWGRPLDQASQQPQSRRPIEHFLGSSEVWGRREARRLSNLDSLWPGFVQPLGPFAFFLSSKSYSLLPAFPQDLSASARSPPPGWRRLWRWGVGGGRNLESLENSGGFFLPPGRPPTPTSPLGPLRFLWRGLGKEGWSLETGSCCTPHTLDLRRKEARTTQARTVMKKEFCLAGQESQHRPELSFQSFSLELSLDRSVPAD